MFSLICTPINCWVNNREAGDLRRHCVHYDAIVMSKDRAFKWEMEVQCTQVNIKVISDVKIKIKNWYTYVALYINSYYQYIFLHNKGKCFSILLNLQTNIFRMDLSKNGPNIQGWLSHDRGKWLNHGPKNLNTISLKAWNILVEYHSRDVNTMQGNSIATIPFHVTSSTILYGYNYSSMS